MDPQKLHLVLLVNDVAKGSIDDVRQSRMRDIVKQS
jgi:hypothetical protein